MATITISTGQVPVEALHSPGTRMWSVKLLFPCVRHKKYLPLPAERTQRGGITRISLHRTLQPIISFVYCLFAYGGLYAFLSHWMDIFCGLHMLILTQEYHMDFLKIPYGYSLTLMSFDKYVKVFIKSK